MKIKKNINQTKIAKYIRRCSLYYSRKCTKLCY